MVTIINVSVGACYMYTLYDCIGQIDHCIEGIKPMEKLLPEVKPKVAFPVVDVGFISHYAVMLCYA